MTVGNLTHAKLPEHAFVLNLLVLFELVDGNESVLDRDKVDQFAVVVDRVIARFDVSLQRELRLFL